jgi:hypothetical protein
MTVLGSIPGRRLGHQYIVFCLRILARITEVDDFSGEGRSLFKACSVLRILEDQYIVRFYISVDNSYSFLARAWV